MAGVSASTVSRVLNGKGAISEETKKRIFDAMEQLKYVPNDFARSFATGSPRAIALVIDVADPGAYSNNFFNNTVFGIETVAHRRDYSLMVTNGSRAFGGISSVERLILGKKVDGVVFPVSLVSREFIRKVEELRFPCVILGRAEDVGAETSWLDINNTQAGVIAVRHLAAKGYRRIGYLGGPESDLFSRDRLSGCCRELDACGLSVDRELILHSDAKDIDAVIAQRLMSRAGGVHHLGRDDLAVFYVVQLEALSVSKVLEDHLFLVVCYSNLHAWPPFARPLY